MTNTTEIYRKKIAQSELVISGIFGYHGNVIFQISLAMDTTTIFRKTPKGMEEIQRRSGQITPRQRRILIMIDGKRSVEELRGFDNTEDLVTLLESLQEQQLIELVTPASSTKEQTIQSTPHQQPSNLFAEPPSTLPVIFPP